MYVRALQILAALTLVGCIGESNSGRDAVATSDVTEDSSDALEGDRSEDDLEDGVQDESLTTGPTWPAAGMTFATWDRGVYASSESDQSLANLADTGARWVSIIVTSYQWNIADTEIEAAEWTPDEDDLRHVIQQAHGLGLKVMLKPHVDLLDDPDHWRGHIGLTFDEEDWDVWFESYTQMILGYAEIAESEGAALFCIGTELSATSHHSAEWRSLVGEVRALYSGQVVYAANHGGEELAIDWWDELDMIGVDPYYGLTDIDQPTVEQLKAGWAEYREALAALSQRYDRQILFTELGYRSALGANRWPWQYGTEVPVDLEGQRNAYQAAFEVFWNEPWFAGVFWWHWSADPDKGGPDDDGYTPNGKPAEEVVRAFYGD